MKFWYIVFLSYGIPYGSESYTSYTDALHNLHKRWAYGCEGETFIFCAESDYEKVRFMNGGK